MQSGCGRNSNDNRIIRGKEMWFEKKTHHTNLHLTGEKGISVIVEEGMNVGLYKGQGRKPYKRTKIQSK